MADFKIKTHTTYSYETSDGRTFDDPEAAETWQEALECIKKVVMLDNKFNRTDSISSAFYVHIKTHEQLDAFQEIGAYEGICADIRSVGFYYYDDCEDTFINIEKEIDRFKTMMTKLCKEGN